MPLADLSRNAQQELEGLQEKLQELREHKPAPGPQELPDPPTTLRGVLDRVKLRHERRYALQLVQAKQSRLTHYVVMTLGVLFGLSAMGIDLTQFAIFASALGVGLGLGLQSITKNFVAGFVVLFERSLKIGDFIELESGAKGTVREINLRGTMITTADNIDIMIPNSEFVDGKVTNWTMRDATCRLRIPFSVAYGTPKDKTKSAVLAAAQSLPFTIMESPRHPQVWLTEFGDSALCYTLVVWVQEDATSRPDAVVAAFNWAIETALSEAGIEIPFPQQDLHLRSYLGLQKDEALDLLHPHRRAKPTPDPKFDPTPAPSPPLLDNDAAEDTMEGMVQKRREQEEREAAEAAQAAELTGEAVEDEPQEPDA